MINKLYLLLLMVFFSSYFQSLVDEDPLPTLGDYSSASISLSGEYSLGRIWLSMYRGSTKEHSDPLMRTYLEDLIYRLSETSEVRDRRFEFIILEDKTINAFAAPGGIIGINLGMFLNTEKEGELASVMCHELAHLSQRHYARSQNKVSPLANALMVLGSIAVAAASRNPEAILIAPAAMQQMSINFTRSNEKEADRIGFNNLVKAGFNPDDMTMMFQRMQSKYQNEDSEQFSYLMTHPLPSERLSDMRIRADSLEKTAKNSYRDNIDFYFMQKRAEIWANKDLKKLIRNYKKDQKSDTKNISFSGSYGLSLAYKNLNDFDKSFSLLRKLIKEIPNNLVLESSLMELHLAAGNFYEAISLGKNILEIHQNNYSASILLADAYIKNEQSELAEKLLKDLSKERQTDPNIWYKLAEAQGLSGNILELHRSRAEFFILTGRHDAAVFQLKEALSLSQNLFEIRESIIKRLEEIFATKRAINELS
ncbi:MAG: putative beta-barrel assembly-enhancing protease [Pseudomonadota bacterium]|nr:MAG: putative beta-barrel assembly-enhancing protease [Pseudomonadota bacterium]|tara:strand:- start:746 stop:2188 length:1443 start_codon:yes stop_codon:yes gene_type:complete